MNNGIAKKWLGKLTRLNPAAGRGKCQGKAPHNVLKGGHLPPNCNTNGFGT
jgi:hypothetical protein